MHNLSSNGGGQLRSHSAMKSSGRSAKFVVLVVTLVAMAFAMSSCGSEESGESENADVQIGTVMPVSGDLSAFGPSAQRAMDLAFELVNEAGGVNGGEIPRFTEIRAPMSKSAPIRQAD